MSTTLKLGWTNPLTDAFGDHPALGPVFDLNDGVTFILVTPGGLDLQPPPRTVVSAGNVRTRGERVTRAIYRHNRQVVARVILGPMASYADLAANIRPLVAWMSGPPAVPITIQYQAQGASLPVYLDVVACAHSLPEDESQWLRLQFEPIELVFVCRPGLRGDRQWLSNLYANPGFEAPTGGGTTVYPLAFSDPFNNVNAYTQIGGSAPTVASNVMTLPSGSSVYFGSPAWGEIAYWQIRLQWFTSGQYSFYLHRTDANNYLQCFVSGTSLTLNQVVGGTVHQLATATVALANSTWYWLQLTQFPSVPGDVAYVQAVLFNDTGPGSIGSQISSIAGPTYDAVTALVGRPAMFATGAGVNLGGAFTNVFAVNLFGPGGVANLTNFGTGFASLGWDGSRPELGMSGTGVAGTQTYPSGPVTSFGAARIDAAPAGTFSASIYQYIGGSPSGTQAIPVKAAGNVLGVSVACKGSGLASSATVSLGVDEYDSNGTFLRGAAVASISGTAANAGWSVLSGTYTTGASCAYVRISLNAFDTATPGTSANAAIWFDNAQCWNVTTTGQSSMPWCQLRMPNSGCELVVSGLLGDLPAPSFLAWGTYLSNWPTGGSLSFAIGRRGSVTPNARLGGSPVGWYGTVLTPQSVCVLDANSYGGFYIQATVTSSGWNPRFISESAADLAGVYHLFNRFQTAQAAGNLPNVSVRPQIQQRAEAWYGETSFTDQVGAYYGPIVAPITQSNAWQVVDAGQVPVPFAPAGALTDSSQLYLTPRGTWADTTGGGSACKAGWQLLVPIDGSLLMGVANNPSNAPFALLTSWLWCYVDGLLVNRAGAADGPSWLYSAEVGPLPNPARGGGGPGTQSTGTINVNSGADPYLLLDPTLQASGQSAGVNQFGAYVADQNGAVLPFFTELAYSPLYLYPR